MKCPTCGKSIDWKDNPFRPFCSERCQLVDLGRWVEGEYRVPGESASHEQMPHEPTEPSRDESDEDRD